MSCTGAWRGVLAWGEAGTRREWGEVTLRRRQVATTVWDYLVAEWLLSGWELVVEEDEGKVFCPSPNPAN